MANHAKVLDVSAADAEELRARVRSKTLPAKQVERARIRVAGAALVGVDCVMVVHRFSTLA